MRFLTRLLGICFGLGLIFVMPAVLLLVIPFFCIFSIYPWVFMTGMYFELIAYCFTGYKKSNDEDDYWDDIF